MISKKEKVAKSDLFARSYGKNAEHLFLVCFVIEMTQKNLEESFEKFTRKKGSVQSLFSLCSWSHTVSRQRGKCQLRGAC